jgi:D-alanyl-D-alanine carboxypeptidase (penicillin-binding protein 5/6)
MDTNQPDTKVSTASIAKVITALCILEKKPLAEGESGPTLTMTSADVQRYQTEVARDGTAFAVSEGDVLTEYETLEAILLPSANNIADSAAIWTFGSIDAYRTYAQAFVIANGMTATTIGPDASGYDASTTSTPGDLVKLAKIALKNPVVMEIVGKPTAVIAGGTQIFNHNALVGKGGITGLKTGRNDDNSGALLFTAKLGEGASAVSVAGVVANAGSLSGALSGTTLLVSSLGDEFPTTVVASRNERVGTLRTAWGATTDIVALDDLSLQHWSGSTLYTYHETHSVPGTQSETVGTLNVKSDGRKATVKIGIQSPASGPSVLWRITHIR